jgi:hypothetical protein
VRRPVHPASAVLDDYAVAHAKPGDIAANFDDLAHGVRGLSHREPHAGIIKPLHQKLVPIIQRDGANTDEYLGRARFRDRLVR